jgi:predicted porin
MKKTLLAVALPALLLSGAAHAQSSVTLYGVIDEGLDFTSNAAGHSGYAMVSGDVAGSRWGLKGSEDLGGGLKAIFQLENGFNINNGKLGQGGLEFGRLAFVGLSSERYGKFTVGRQYDPTVDMWSGFTAAGNTMGDFASHPFDNDNADWDFQIQNSVKYVSPTYHGFTGEAMYGFSNTAGAFATNRMYSAAGTYTIGGLSAVLAYMKINNGGEGTTGAVSSSTTVFTATSQQDIDAGLSYTFDNKAMLAFAYSHTDVYNPTANAYFSEQPVAGTQNSWKFDNFEVNGQYFIKPDVWLAAAYTYTFAHVSTDTGRSMPKWNQFSVMLDYDISKRTSVYVQAAYQHVNGDTGTQFDDAVIPGSSANSTSDNQTMVRLGMTHHF